jgi:hypothetical protein
VSFRYAPPKSDLAVLEQRRIDRRRRLWQGGRGPRVMNINV